MEFFHLSKITQIEKTPVLYQVNSEEWTRTHL